MATATFEVRKFRDIEVVVNTADEKRPINLTKLAASLTGSRQSFKRLIKHNDSFWKIIASYTTSETTKDLVVPKGTTKNNASKTAEDLVSPFGLTKNHDLQELFDKGVLIFFNGQPSWRAGTYGPTWLADWIVINFKPEFFKQIHELFEVVDKLAHVHNGSFEKEMKEIIKSKDNQIKLLTDENYQLVQKNRTLEERLDKMEAQNDEIIHIVGNDAETLDEILKVVRGDVQEIKTSIDDSAEVLRRYDARTITTGTYREVLIVYSLVQHNAERFTVYTFCGNENNFEKSLFTKGLAMRDIQILGQFNTSNSKDLVYNIAEEMGLKTRNRTIEMTEENIQLFLYRIQLKLGSLNLNDISRNIQEIIARTRLENKLDAIAWLVGKQVYICKRYRELHEDENGYYVEMANGKKHYLNNEEIETAKRLNRK